MTLTLYGHPFSSYTWKALIALYEKQLPFEFRVLGPDHPEHGAALAAVWPAAKFPVLVDGDRPVIESSIIVEYLDRLVPEPRLVPADAETALEVRLLDRVFDLHVQGPMQAVVAEHLPHLVPVPDPQRITRARAALDAIYPWLDVRLAGRRWAAGDGFTLADCAAAPALFYADWVQRIPAELAALSAYRARLLARPAIARAVEEARPYRGYFPLGAPDRD